MRAAVDLGPVGQIIVVRVGIVEEAALLDDEFPRVRAHLPAIPAEGPRTGRLLDGADGAFDRLAFLVPGHFIVVAPAIAMARHLVASAHQLRRHRGIAFERHRAAEERDRDTGGVEDSEHPPDPGSRPVLVHRLHREISLVLDGERQLVHAVVCLVAHRESLLRSFLVVDNDLHGHLGPVQPAHARRVLAIADQLAWQARHVVDIRIAEELWIHFHAMIPSPKPRPLALPGPGAISAGLDMILVRTSVLNPHGFSPMKRRPNDPIAVDAAQPLRRLRRAELPLATISLARYLIGKILVREEFNGRASGRIVETEAYPPGDASGHAFHGLTPRNRTLYRQRGLAYVYFIYGSSYMCNVTSEAAGVGAGVLLRALEPLDGIPLMIERRGTSRLVDLARGPGRLAAAMGIDRQCDGIDLCAVGELWLAAAPWPRGAIDRSVRIGITREVDRLSRFYERGNRFVSRPRHIRV